MGLACRELELERVAQSVHAQVNLAAEATAASAQALCPLAPLLRGAPAAQGWARIMVLSSSMSGSGHPLPDASLTPAEEAFIHDWPYSVGSARHWAPVRAIHKVPVRKRRQFSSCPTYTPGQVRKN